MTPTHMQTNGVQGPCGPCRVQGGALAFFPLAFFSLASP
jgi:hypothetical protein